MIRFWYASAFALCCVAIAWPAAAQGTLADYQRAERFMSPGVDTLVIGATVRPRWITGSERFWYRKDLPHAREYYVVDPVRRTRTPAFEQSTLATALSVALGGSYRGDSLDITDLQFDGRAALTVTLREGVARCTLPTYQCTRAPTDSVVAGRSPDGKWVAFVRDFNLFVRDAASGAERALTTDGTRDQAYATPIVNPGIMIQQASSTPRLPAAVSWSPDSRRVVTVRMDTRRAGRLTMTQFAPPGDVRPRSYEYVYPLAIDSVLPTQEYIVFEVDGWRRTNVQGQIEQYYYGATLPRWYPDGRRLSLTRPDRGYTMQRLYEFDAITGAQRVVVEESAQPYFDSYGSSIVESVRGGADVLWASQRDGWNHLYLYNGTTGALTRQITSGEYVVSAMERVDTTSRRVYYSARGRESGRDPYLAHLYSVSLDGGTPRLLTPENGEHAVTFSPNGTYFVDTWSRVDQAPITVLRRANDGALVMELERADITRLLATGWRAPEPFTVMARDGKTPMYGLIWKPTTFDSTRRYPVVENVYSGPHGFFVPKTFVAASRGQQQAIAELGFISIMLDAPGTAGRSRAFHDVSYKNLGGGTDEHPAAITQVASSRPYMDIARVGIWGHSAGGYDAAHAILKHTDFYKVAVSSAGDHDARLDKAVWNTQWMGHPVAEQYAQQANAAIAGNLKGKLFLMHGDVDDNVPIAETMQLADALIRANKSFDLLVMPGQNHGSGGTPYFTRRRWDYFVQHLLGVEPPENYRIGGR